MKRLKFQKIAEDIKEREKKIINTLQTKYSKQVADQLVVERQRIHAQYNY